MTYALIAVIIFLSYGLIALNKKSKNQKKHSQQEYEKQIAELQLEVQAYQEKYSIEAETLTNEKASHLKLISKTLDDSANNADHVSQELESITEHSSSLSSQLAEIHQLATHSNQNATQGQDKLQTASEQLALLNTTQQELSALLSRFQEITEKSKAISHVSTEAEMLALNAAIEAARAGEAGRGFAIVAGNMKDLAKKTQMSTMEILKIVQTSDQEITAIANSFAQQELSLSASIEELMQSFNVIHDSVNKIDRYIQEIDNSAKHNLESTKLVSSNVKTSVENLVQQLSKLVSMITGREVLDHSPQQVKSNWQNYDEVIDVRREKEWNDELGHIQGVSFSTLQTDFKNKVKSLDPEKSYLFVCRSGGRSTKAAQMALTHGISQVYNLEGGMLAWREAGF